MVNWLIIPKKEYKVKKNLPDWFTDELLNLKKDRDFFKKAKITGEEADWFVAKNLRNTTNVAMRAAKAENIKDQLEINCANPKKFWTTITVNYYQMIKVLCLIFRIVLLVDCLTHLKYQI